ncbi:hypothetical protein LCGC14_2845380, partial [marine sediment metagenome]
DFEPTLVTGGDTNGDGLLDPGETWSYTETSIATAGQYTNIAKVVGMPVLGIDEPIPEADEVIDDDPSNYFGVDAKIHIEKFTEGAHADTPTGEIMPIGHPIDWTYDVTNPGNVPLANVTVTDDNGTPGDTGDDFPPTFVDGDTNTDGLLDPGEMWRYWAGGTAAAGQYTNIADVVGTPVLGIDQPIPEAENVTDDDPSNYFGVDAKIHIEKTTNTDDADAPTGPIVPIGNPITWTYDVTNPGNVPLANVTVTDDNGTPGDTADDFEPTLVTGGDTNGDGLLDPGETWQYTETSTATAGQYTNIAVVVGTPVLGIDEPIPEAENVTADDPSNYLGVNAKIHIEKATNGDNDDAPTGPIVLVGSPITWTYEVTNPGNVPLSNVTVTDDNGTPGDTADDFEP